MELLQRWEESSEIMSSEETVDILRDSAATGLYLSSGMRNNIDDFHLLTNGAGFHKENAMESRKFPLNLEMRK